MAENEKLDLAYPRSGRWRKWRESILSGQSLAEVANEGVRCLVQTFNRLQPLFSDENRIPLKQVLLAATGEDGCFDEIMRQAKLGRDYLQLFEFQSGQQLDGRTIVENVMTLTIDRVMDQIRHELIGGQRFPDAKSFREFRLSLGERMVDSIQVLAKQLADSPDMNLRMPSRTAEQKDQHQVELLNMSIGAQPGTKHE